MAHVTAGLLDEMSAPPLGSLTLRVDVYCSGAHGPRRVATGSLPVSAPHAHGDDEPSAHVHTAETDEMYLRRVPLLTVADEADGRGGGEDIGELRLSLLCADVLRAAARRLTTQPSMTVSASELCLSAACQVRPPRPLCLPRLQALHALSPPAGCRMILRVPPSSPGVLSPVPP